MAKHWNIRYRFITQCSKDHPFERKLKGNKISYEDPEELLEFLINSEEASMIWTDSEDLAVVADMFQIKIKIITSKGKMEKNPTANWIYPEVKMKQFSEVKDVNHDDMVLFHQNDCHFNLVVSSKSDLATLGNLSHRFNIGPFLETKDSHDDNNIDKQTEVQNL